MIAHGAAWIWNLSRIRSPNAIEIVDIYHAREHLWELGRHLFPLDQEQRRHCVRRRKQQLDEGRIEAAYFEGHADRMRYAEFRRQNLFVGSGVIAAGWLTVVGRLKRSGRFWTVDGANAVIALRCAALQSL